MKSSNTGLFFLGIFLSLGLASTGYFISQTMYNAKVALNTAEAKGLAEKRVQADRANWVIAFNVAGARNASVPALYKQSENHQQIIVDLLQKHGLEEQEITLGIINYYHQEFRDDNRKLVDARHQLSGSIHVETDKVQLIAKVRAAVNKLIAEGIGIENRAPTYRFTKLNQIKPEMLREATKNARLAANEFAENAGVQVGGIRSARQGNFFIRDAGEEYGDTAKIEKDVRVVTTITFYLTE
ncbi:MAG: SIMPL domain-containing protein [Alphaproteobacteria bacterium]